MKNKYDENMSKSTDMNTTHDVTWFQGTDTVLPPKVDFGSEEEHFPFSILDV